MSNTPVQSLAIMTMTLMTTWFDPSLAMAPWGSTHDSPFDIPGMYGRVDGHASKKTDRESYSVTGSSGKSTHIAAIAICVVAGVICTALVVHYWTYQSQKQLQKELDFERSISIALDYDGSDLTGDSVHEQQNSPSYTGSTFSRMPNHPSTRGTTYII